MKKVEDLEGEVLLDKGIKMQREWRMSMKEEPSNKGVSWTIDLDDKEKLDYIYDRLMVSY